MEDFWHKEMKPTDGYTLALPTPELDAYFNLKLDPSNVNHPDLPLNLLDRGASAKLTQALIKSPEIWFLGGIVLDDGNLSNYHVYLTRPPFTGTILFWQHDDQHYVAFSSLSEFLAAVERSKEQHVWLKSLHTWPMLTDSLGLARFIEEMAAGDSESNYQLADIAMTCAAHLDIDLLSRLVSHPWYFFKEGVAAYIARQPAHALRPLAVACAGDSLPQIRWQADAALQAIDNLDT